MNPTIKRTITIVLDIILIAMAVFLLVLMARYLFSMIHFLSNDLTVHNFEALIQKLLAFFMMFEFVMMILRYIEEGHHIPIRYLVFISITAILRQIMVSHDNGQEIFLLCISIFILCLTLLILNITKRPNFSFIKSKKVENLDQKEQQTK